MDLWVELYARMFVGCLVIEVTVLQCDLEFLVRNLVSGTTNVCSQHFVARAINLGDFIRFDMFPTLNLFD